MNSAYYKTKRGADALGLVITYVFPYIILVPFLYPLGFTQYITDYKTFFDYWLFMSVILICVNLFFRVITNRVKITLPLFFIVVYYVFLGLNTISKLGALDQGIQKIIIAPFLSIYLLICLKDRKKQIISSILNIELIILFLNITIFNPLFIQKEFPYFEYHYDFLGHVQVSAPIGLLGIYIGYLYLKIFGNSGKKFKVKAYALVLLSIITMFLSGTMASEVSLLIIVFYLLFRKTKLTRIFKMNVIIYFLIFLLLDILLMKYASDVLISEFHGIDISFSARTIIWRNEFTMIPEHLITGYGVFGALIKTPWSPLGMNYAHNEIMQLLLDGGVLLLVIFIALLLSYITSINYLKDEMLRKLTSVILCLIFFVMLFESLTEYFYIFILLSLVYYSRDIEVSYEN